MRYRKGLNTSRVFIWPFFMMVLTFIVMGLLYKTLNLMPSLWSFFISFIIVVSLIMGIKYSLF